MDGRNQLEIGPAEIARGMSTSPFISDGGFSPGLGSLDSVLNPQIKPGVIYGPAAEVNGDSDTILTGEFIASSPYHDGSSERIAVAKQTDGTAKYYRYSGTSNKLTALSGTDSTNSDYQKGSTDMRVYKGATFITTRGAVIKWSGTSTFNFSYHAFTNAGKHPMIVFEDNLYYGDGNLLKRQTNVSGTPATILTLPTGYFITALEVDRGTGRILIAASLGLNVNNTRSVTNKLHWYDGFSNKVDKVVEVDDQIFALYALGNTVFAGYGQNVGYISGSGVNFLRKLRYVGLALEELPNRHNFANIGNTLYVVDNKIILAFGEILPGQKIWWQAFKSSVRIDSIMPLGNNRLGFSYTTSIFSTLDISTTSTISTLRFISNRYSFPRPIIIKSIYLEYVDALADASANRTLNIYLPQEGFDTANQLALLGGTSLQNNSGGNLYELFPVIGIPNNKNKMMSFQIEYIQSTTNWGLRRIIIYYDFYE
jgi:hypothetical protein